METGKLVAFGHAHAPPCFAEQDRRGAAGGAAADNRNIITFHRQKVAEFAGKQKGSARVSRVGEGVSPSRTFLQRLFRRDAETSTREARATGTLRQTRRFMWFEHAAPCKEHAFVLTNQQMKLIDRFVSRELIVNLLFAIFVLSLV